MVEAISAHASQGGLRGSAGGHRLCATDTQRVAIGWGGLRSAETYGQVAELFRALSDPSRVKIVDALARQELCTRDLALIIGISEPAVSQHLRVLRVLQVVSSHRHGSRVFYSLDDDHIRKLLSLTVAHVEDPHLRGLSSQELASA
jgi:DNA-binding transcriptional ArsR family regulator